MEALVSTTITVVAGSAILLSIASSLRSTNDLLETAQAAGIAAQLMDEVAGRMWAADLNNPNQWPLTPNSYETAGACRERYNDIDDYVSFSCTPPKDMWGNVIGSGNGQGGLRDPAFVLPQVDFANWQTSISVYYVNPANPAQALAAGSTSEMRAVEVTVSATEAARGTRTLFQLRRVFTHVPHE